MVAPPPLGLRSFYDQVPELKASSPSCPSRCSRLARCRFRAETLKLVLTLLGNPSLERMLWGIQAAAFWLSGCDPAQSMLTVSTCPLHLRGLLAFTPGCDSVDVIIIICLYRLNSNTLKKEDFALLFLNQMHIHTSRLNDDLKTY